jgi:hypothetical protein
MDIPRSVAEFSLSPLLRAESWLYAATTVMPSTQSHRVVLVQFGRIQGFASFLRIWSKGLRT